LALERVMSAAAAPAHEIERRVALRLKRQDLLSKPNPPRMTRFIEQVARET
jgi:hypothetical protein